MGNRPDHLFCPRLSGIGIELEYIEAGPVLKVLEWRTLCDPPEEREGGDETSAHNLKVSPVENQIVSEVTGL